MIKYVDVLLGNEEDFTQCLGYKDRNVDDNLNNLDSESHKEMVHGCLGEYTNIKVVATTLRTVKTANINDWGTILYCNGKFCNGQIRRNLEIFDRVGGEDSFASCMIYGFLSDKSPEEIVEYGAVHGALVTTTRGDTYMASISEVGKMIKGNLQESKGKKIFILIVIFIDKIKSCFEGKC